MRGNGLYYLIHRNKCLTLLCPEICRKKQKEVSIAIKRARTMGERILVIRGTHQEVDTSHTHTHFLLQGSCHIPTSFQSISMIPNSSEITVFYASPSCHVMNYILLSWSCIKVQDVLIMSCIYMPLCKSDRWVWSNDRGLECVCGLN